ncbi:MAG: ComEA family DNA-binding protein [Actinomycetota bacterium]
MSDLSLRDRLATLSRRELIGMLVLVASLVGAVAVWYLRSLPEPVAVQQVGGAIAPSSSPSAVAQGSGLTAPGASATPAAGAGGSQAIFVHVAGEVRRPGVYEFVPGDRVIDAIDAARGPTGRAVLDGLNLAALLTDGSQIVVPERGATAPGGLPAAPGAGEGDTINVNTADAIELEELSGIGEVLAQEIIDHRIENGPFTSIDELEDVSGIGPATLEEIRDHVTI